MIEKGDSPKGECQLNAWGYESQTNSVYDCLMRSSFRAGVAARHASSARPEGD